MKLRKLHPCVNRQAIIRTVTHPTRAHIMFLCTAQSRIPRHYCARTPSFIPCIAAVSVSEESAADVSLGMTAKFPPRLQRGRARRRGGRSGKRPQHCSSGSTPRAWPCTQPLLYCGGDNACPLTRTTSFSRAEFTPDASVFTTYDFAVKPCWANHPSGGAMGGSG